MVRFQLSRWLQAADRIYDEDKLLDHWISLEGLFGDGRSELSLTASLRAAAYVGSTPADREAIYRSLRLSYRWRSYVVHGGGAAGAPRDLTKHGTLRESATATRAILRSVLLKLIQSREAFSADTVEEILFHRIEGDEIDP